MTSLKYVYVSSKPNCRAAERPSRSDTVSGKRGLGPGGKPAPPVTSAGLLLQLGIS